MRLPRVVESRLAFEPEAHGPAHGPHNANDLVHLPAAAHVLDRHEVDHFADTLGAKKARQQHVAVGQVHLLVLSLVEARDLEEASFALIENGGKNAWRVELRKATPVDRTIHAHQRDRVQVADDAIGLDRLIDHFDIRLSEMASNAVRGSFSTFRHKISIQKARIGGLVLGEVSSGCWPCETPPVAPHVEMSPSNCCSES